MSKRSKSKRDKKDDAINLSTSENEKVHKPQVERSHIAQELREHHQTEVAEPVTRQLLPDARCRAMGTKPGHYIHRGWMTRGRRTIEGLE